MRVTSIQGIGPATAEKLGQAGITSVEHLAGADAAAVAEQTDLSERRLEGFIDRARTANETESDEDSGPRLLTGGNPQIPKGDGDAPVQAYIEAMPGWKHDVGRFLDDLIERTVPGVRKAVRWNQPFYGIEGQGWFASYTCVTRYVKMAFFRGSSLDPVPPVESKREGVRYVHIFEDGEIDEALLASWIEQAAALPGEAMF